MWLLVPPNLPRLNNHKLSPASCRCFCLSRVKVVVGWEGVTVVGFITNTGSSDVIEDAIQHVDHGLRHCLCGEEFHWNPHITLAEKSSVPSADRFLRECRSCPTTSHDDQQLRLQHRNIRPLCSITTPLLSIPHPFPNRTKMSTQSPTHRPKSPVSDARFWYSVVEATDAKGKVPSSPLYPRIIANKG